MRVTPGTGCPCPVARNACGIRAWSALRHDPPARGAPRGGSLRGRSGTDGRRWRGGGAADVDARGVRAARVWRPPRCGTEAPPPVVGGSHRAPRAVGGWRVAGPRTPTTRVPGSADAQLPPAGGSAPACPHHAWPDGRRSGVRPTAAQAPGRAEPQQRAVGGSRRRTARAAGGRGQPYRWFDYPARGTSRPPAVGGRPCAHQATRGRPVGSGDPGGRAARHRACPRCAESDPAPHATRVARSRYRRPVRTGSRTSRTVGRSGRAP